MTKSRIGLAVLAVVLLFVVAHAQTVAQLQSTSTGRYQLLSADHYLIGANSVEKAVLKIDTATGIVDEWVTGVDARE
jgi:hypothetical protein